MNPVIEVDDQQLTNDLDDLLIQEQASNHQGKQQLGCEVENHHGVCAICLDKIKLEETALVKGCEHAYCVICILRWATYRKEPTCPHCKHPFEFLKIHRSLDGSVHDFMFEESVCLLLRAPWFKPLHVKNQDLDDEVDDFYLYGDEIDDFYPYGEEVDLGDVYFSSSSSIHFGNRRGGQNGYVRAEKREAMPVHQLNAQDNIGPSPEKKDAMKDAVTVGRRAKRTLKREAANKAAAEKHQQLLMSLGRH